MRRHSIPSSGRRAGTAARVGVALLVLFLAVHEVRSASETEGVAEADRSSAEVNAAPKLAPDPDVHRLGADSPKHLQTLQDLARRSQEQSAHLQLERARWQSAIVGASLLLVLCTISASRPNRPWALTARRAALAGLALAALGSYYGRDLFDRRPAALHLKDVFHYYMGSKYFPELGYDRIYECSLAIASERGWWWVDTLRSVRDLRTLRRRPARALIERGKRECKPLFSTERWESFGQDLAWFDAHLLAHRWQILLADHGYNPSPVWALLAMPFTRAGPELLWVLARVDSLLVLGALLALGWAFGFETLCLATIVWGTGWLWSAEWIGHSFLRQIWFAATVIGLACLRRRRDLVAGILLATAALLRAFPAVFVGAYALTALRQSLATRSVPAEARRFAAGAAVSSLVLIGASAWVSGHGLDSYVEFGRTLSAYRQITAVNMAGLPALLWRVDASSSGQRAAGVPTSTVAIRVDPRLARVIALSVVAVGLLLFWKVLRRIDPWEATAVGFALIPLLSAPPGYYFEFVVLGVPLATRRPWVAVWLLSACLAWLLNGIAGQSRGAEYALASLVAMVLSFGVLVVMLRPPRVITASDG